MDTKILWAFATIGVASATAGMGVFAFFSDTAVSADNLFTAGTIDLQLNGLDSVSAIAGGSNAQPGDCFGGVVSVANAGSIGSSDVDLDVAIDLLNNQGPDGLGAMPRFLRIQTLTYGGAGLAVVDLNGNGFPDLEDWDQTNAASTDLAAPGAGAGAKTLDLSVCLDESAGNELQGDTVNVTFVFQLAQIGADDLPPNPA